ncbi:MAG TPA: anthranilate phosphoribosyltransferase [Gemmatimonadota bacterium]|nr:anthranilate phosphoribosyltransferase [Gemmatimonadota bacterium]
MPPHAAVRDPHHGGPGLSDEAGLAAGDPHACLHAISERRDLTPDAAAALFGRMMDGEVPPVLTGALLAALRTKGETVQEIAAAARAMRARAAPVTTSRTPLVDTCGTGGDFSMTFNVSTAAALVAAGAGVAVAKHGNRAASSRCGSADVLEAAGVVIDLDPRASGRILDRAGIAFLYAPNFHPATRHAAASRRELRIRTVFNLLGPLTNPAGVRRQVIGVPGPAFAEPVAETLRELGAEHALVVSGRDGVDEISVSAPSLVVTVRDGEVTRREVDPEELGLGRHARGELAGGDAGGNAGILRRILEGGGSRAQDDFVAANAAAALVVAGVTPDLGDGVGAARELLASGAGAEALDRLITVSKEESRRK